MEVLVQNNEIQIFKSHILNNTSLLSSPAETYSQCWENRPGDWTGQASGSMGQPVEPFEPEFDRLTQFTVKLG